MSELRIKNIRRKIEIYLPRIVRQYLKRIFKKIILYYNISVYIKKGKLVEIGYRFRFTRLNSFRGTLGDRTIIEEFNVWNAKAGDIMVGKDCWFGLHNIVMGPVIIGNNVSTGPHVTILGPRHAKQGAEERKKGKTIIGNNVWISTGAIILFGVNIGDNVIIGPGSVVNKDIPEDAYVSGNPARNLSKLAEVSWKTDKKV